MLNDVSAVFHPRSLHETIVQNVGHAPATSMLGNQDRELINDFMLSNWTYTAQWQAKAFNYLMENEGYEVIFSHFHGVEDVYKRQIFTLEPNTGGQYYVINYDDGGSTSSVTSGSGEGLQVYYQAKSFTAVSYTHLE